MWLIRLITFFTNKAILSDSLSHRVYSGKVIRSQEREDDEPQRTQRAQMGDAIFSFVIFVFFVVDSLHPNTHVKKRQRCFFHFPRRSDHPSQIASHSNGTRENPSTFTPMKA
jgi:hypothetical protein